MKKLLSILLAVTLLIGCFPLAVFAAEAPVTDFAYEGDAICFVKADGVTQFGMFAPQEGTTAALDGDNVVIHYVPKNKTVYNAPHFGLITDVLTADVTFNEDGAFDITLPKTKCGNAWAVAPIKKNDPSATTSDQYYLAIPAEEKFTPKTTELTVTNNTKMFKVEKAELRTVLGHTDLVFSLSGTGYRRLFKGTYEEADAAGESGINQWINGYENAEGKWEFVVPVTEQDTYIPLVAISESYYQNYLNGQSLLSRAFYARQLELDFELNTLVAGDYTRTIDLSVSNSSSLPVSKATLTTVGCPNSNNYASTLTLTMGNEVYTKAYFGLAENAASASSVVEPADGAFPLVMRKIKTAGDPSSIENHLDQDTSVAFYNASAQSWEDFTLNASETNKKLIVYSGNPSTNTYLITFVNYDGSELLSLTVPAGQPPIYNGPVPQKAADDDNYYVFSAWDPEIEPAAGNSTYTATYDSIPKMFVYNGDAVNFIKADASPFGMFAPQDGTTAELNGDTVTIHYVPKNTTIYNGLHFGSIHDAELTKDVTFHKDGTFDITLPKAKCGYAWVVAPIKASDPTATTGVQYYLAIPSEDKLQSSGGGTTPGGGGGGGGPETPADETIDLTVTNNVRMFKIIEAKLQTTNGNTRLVVTLNGSGYHYLFKGTFTEASNIGYKPSKWVAGTLNNDDKYVFSIPVQTSDTEIPIVSISQTYVDQYLAGSNPIERAFFPRLFTLNAKNKTLVVDDFKETKSLSISNSTDLDIDSASLSTVGGPNSNEYSSTLTLVMKSGTYTKAFIGTAADAANSHDTIAANRKSFYLKLRWMATAGDLNSIVSYIGKNVVMAFYNADKKEWEEVFIYVNDSKYSLTVSADGTAEPVPAEGTDGNLFFIDVKSSDWFAPYAQKAAELGFMTGYDAGKKADGNTAYAFRGSAKVTRAMFVTILRAMEIKIKGSVKDAPSAGFKDVVPGSWYEKAVDWAFANGIAAGRGDDFGVDDNVSRQDMAVFMYAYAKHLGKVKGNVDLKVLDTFKDKEQIADYAKEAVAWLVSEGLMTGRSSDTLAPLDPSSRAEIAAFAVSAYEYLSK